MATTNEVDTRATVCAIGGIVLGVLAVATVVVPLTALAMIDDDTVRAVVATLGLPFALVGGVLALGTAYLTVAGWGSAHAVTAGVLFLLAFAGAIAIAVATNSAEKYSGPARHPVGIGASVPSTGDAAPGGGPSSTQDRRAPSCAC